MSQVKLSHDGKHVFLDVKDGDNIIQVPLNAYEAETIGDALFVMGRKVARTDQTD